MDLLLKRNRRGGQFELFAKYELTPEEQSIINTSAFRDEILWSVSRPAHRQVPWILARWGLRILGFLVGVFGGYYLAELLHLPFIFIALVPWIGMAAGVIYLPRLADRKLHDEIRVRHVLTGLTMTANEEELIAKEKLIHEMGQKIKTYLEERKARGRWDDSSERIAL